MRHINGVYTQRYKRCLNLDGQLFRGRYKSVLFEEGSHLLELLRYIYRNPVRAQMCNTVDDYPWSSHEGYISSSEKWDWLYTDLLLWMFSQKRQKARGQYKDNVGCEDSREVTDFFSKKNLASILGSQEFVDRIKVIYQQTAK